MNDRNIFIGVMSGSSIDGLDIVACTFTNLTYQTLAFETYSISPLLAERLETVRKLNVLDYLKLKSDYSIHIAQCLSDFISKNHLKEVNLIVIHGHTVFHEPKQMVSEQMVDGGLISALLDSNVLVDLRIQDIGKGGEGAPLAPIVEKLLQSSNCYLNLGGICNISLHINGNVIAYDIAPCNQLLNHIAKQMGVPYDDEGKFGEKGKLLPHLLSQWESISYFSSTPPKSLDNSWIEQNFIKTLPAADPADLLQTAYQFISDCIFDAFKTEHDLIDKVIITGGGAHNDYLMSLISSKIYTLGIHTEPAENLLIDSKEALLMAYMGYLYMNNMPNTIASATGASDSLVAGGFYKSKSKI